MAMTTIEGQEEAALHQVVVRPAARCRRWRLTASVVAGAVAVLLVGLGGHLTDDTEPGDIARGRAADAYFARQASIAP